MSTNRELAIEFIRHFCNGDIDGLAPLLSPSLRFSGPLFDFSSAQEYLNILREGELEKCSYSLVSVTEGPEEVVVFYDYLKSDSTLRVAQLFRFQEQKICDIQLVFDTKSLA